MDYEGALEYIGSFTDFEKRTGYSYSEESFDLRRPRELLSLLGEPQERYPTVLVAGTKGKGSTSAMIASILRASGRRVGLYSQPHLHTFRERIRVDGTLISREQFASAVEAVVPAVDRLMSTRPELGPPTTYEVATAAAMLFFAQQAPDLVVLEVGLGGRLDATNVVNPLVAVITTISLDHVQILGDTIAQIASEKAGIIKEGGVVVASEQTGEAMAVIRRVAAERGARLVVAGVRERRGDGGTGGRGEEDAGTRGRGDAEKRRQDESPTYGLPSPARRGAGGEVAHAIRERTEAALSGPSGDLYSVSMPLLGAHQLSNAATAIAVVELLRDRGFEVSKEAVEEGLARVEWPGRLEIVSRDPLVVVDGAHNGDSARRLAAALVENFAYDRLILVLGTSADKDVEGIVGALAPLASTVIATRSRHARAADPVRLTAEAGHYCPATETAPDVPSALRRASTIATPADLICVTGSLFTVADARDRYGLAGED